MRSGPGLSPLKNNPAQFGNVPDAPRWAAGLMTNISTQSKGFDQPASALAATLPLQPLEGLPSSCLTADQFVSFLHRLAFPMHRAAAGAGGAAHAAGGRVLPLPGPRLVMPGLRYNQVRGAVQPISACTAAAGRGHWPMQLGVCSSVVGSGVAKPNQAQASRWFSMICKAVQGTPLCVSPLPH